MDWSDYISDSARNLAAYRKAEPEGAAAFIAMAKAGTSEGALSVKQKELMCLAIGIIRQCNDCIGFHVKALIRAGATREEVAETVTVTMYMGGGPAYMYGARALEAYDHFAGKAAQKEG